MSIVSLISPAVFGFCLLCATVVGSDTFAFKTDIALYSADGKLLWESASYKNWGTSPDQVGWIGEMYPLCPKNFSECDGVHNYIGKSGVWNAEGGNNLFNYLETQQYALPNHFAEQVSIMKFTVKILWGGPSRYRVLHHTELINNDGNDWISQYWGGSKPSPQLPYPQAGAKVGDPIHLSVIAVQPDGAIQGNRMLGIWISFRSSPPCTASVDSHCCHLTDPRDNLWQHGFHDSEKKCTIDRPHYQCFQPNGSQWSSGQQVGFINFVGSLNQMADGKPIEIHFDDAVESAIPFTNSYAKTEVTPSAACASICDLLYGNQPWSMSAWQDSISSCKVSKAEKVAQAGLGPLRIRGFGRLSGFQLMDSGMDYFGRDVWKDFDGTNGGSYFVGGVFGDHYKTMEWAVMSGLAELTTSDSSAEFAIDISNIAIAWAPKRGDGAVLVNAPYVALDDGSNSNRPARIWDVKTPGAWVDAADGPNLLGDNSIMEYAYLHHADDLVKISASGIRYGQITALQGNVGSVILLGNYGLGLRTGTITKSNVSGVSIHRVVHAAGGYDGNGGIFGTRTCPNGITFSSIAVNNVTIQRLDNANTVGQLFAIGALSGWAPFCSGTRGSVSFSDLIFHNWQVYVTPSMNSKMFGDGGSTTVIDNVQFYDTTHKSKDSILSSAVQIFDTPQHWRCVCAVVSGADKCWDMNGPNTSSTSNFDFYEVSATQLWFPYGHVPVEILQI